MRVRRVVEHDLLQADLTAVQSRVVVFVAVERGCLRASRRRTGPSRASTPGGRRWPARSSRPARCARPDRRRLTGRPPIVELVLKQLLDAVRFMTSSTRSTDSTPICHPMLPPVILMTAGGDHEPRRLVLGADDALAVLGADDEAALHERRNDDDAFGALEEFLGDAVFRHVRQLRRTSIDFCTSSTSSRLSLDCCCVLTRGQHRRAEHQTRGDRRRKETGISKHGNDSL